MTVDLDSVRKLEEQLRADDAAMTPAPWMVPSYDGAEARIARTRNALPVIADTLRDLRAEVERLATELEREERDCLQLIEERDQREQQINEIADALGDETEWSNLNDRGDNAFELTAAMVQQRDAARSDYLIVADALLPESTGPQQLADEARRLRAEVDRLLGLARTAEAARARAVGDLDAERARGKELEAEVAAMRPVVDAALVSYGSQRGGHFGHPRPTDAMLELADAIDTYRARKP
jgi:chromosome segregation ATPase